MSSSFADSIYLATRVVFDADQLQKEDLMAEVGSYLKASLGALGLTLPATSAIRLVNTWMYEDAAVESDTWELLKSELDRDRLSRRRLWT